MPCNEWKDQWIAQLYGELDPAEGQLAERHLAACSACRRTLEELGSSRRILRECAPAVPAAPRVVMLRPRGHWRAGWAFASGLALGATALVAIALLAWGPARRGADEPPSPDWSRVEARLQQIELLVHEIETRPAASVQETGRQPLEPQLTRAQFNQELERISRRFDVERARDLETFWQSLMAAQVRADTRMDRTEQALTYLALRQDPRLRER